jgi:hypothetical protein
VFHTVSFQDVKRILTVADLYLDSFPYSGATTTVEALSMGVPVVAFEGTSQRAHQAAGWLTEFGLEAWIASGTEDYAALCCKLINSPAQRRKYSDIAQRNSGKALAQNEFSQWFSVYLAGGTRAEDGPRHLFHHLPKSGGTSIRKIMSEWFEIVSDYREPWSTMLPEPMCLEQFSRDQLLCGHFATDGMPLGLRYPETQDRDKWRRITFIRDPLETALSNYFFEVQNRPKYDPSFQPKPLGTFLREYQGLYLHHFECTADTYCEALKSYWFIGTLERIEVCMMYLARVLGKPPPNIIPHENQTVRRAQLDPADVDVFVQNMALEFEIYREVSAQLRQIFGEQELDQFPR